MNPGLDPYDELAALFLTEPDAPRRGNGIDAVARRELLLVGHLPVRAGVWLAPYADAIAREAGPTALLRLDDAIPHLQVLRGADVPDEQCSLQQAIDRLRGQVGTWIIRVASDEAPRRLATSGADRITLLSGADEAALVAAYQTIKQLAAAAEDAGVTLPGLGVAIMGSDESTARSAVKRLNQTTHQFIGVELSLVLCLPRMDAGMISSGYRRFIGERCPEPAEVMRWIAEASSEPGRSTPSTRVVEPPPETSGQPARQVESPPPAAPSPPASRHVSTPPAGERVASASPSPPPMRLRPKATIDVEPKHPATPREPEENGRPVPLASHVDGLTPLPVRCPGSEDVEIAVEQGGRLHLLGREQALRRMPIVRRWVVDHREIIAMACTEHAIDVRQSPRVHLFTDAPVSVADLHPTEFQLHVLTPVKVGDQVGWYSAALNKPGQRDRGTEGQRDRGTEGGEATRPVDVTWIDGHLDLAYLALDGRDLRASSVPDGTGCVTLPALRDAGVVIVFATIFTEPTERDEGPWTYRPGDVRGAVAAGRRQLEVYRQLDADGSLRLVRDRAEVDERDDLRAVLLMEGADPIRDPEDVAGWHDAGLRLVGLTWSLGTRYAGGNARPGPLTSAGVTLVAALDEAGIVHDASHLADDALDGLFERSRGPIVATHSNCRTLLGSGERHLRDEHIAEIGSRGGVVGLNLHTAFLAKGRRATVSDAADHVEHTAEVMGRRDGVALGSDMDGGFGPEGLPIGLDHPTRLDALATELSNRGWSPTEVDGFKHANWRRYLAAVL